MPIVPDTKDWTFVLERTCDECSFDVRTFPREQVGDMVRTVASRWRGLLAHPNVRRRPSDDRWSGLEYACHVRDVFRLYDYRLDLMLTQDDPHYPNWDQDASATENAYAEDDPERVAGEIEAAADDLAEHLDSVRGEQWERTGNRGDGVRFTIESFARCFIHDPIHHVDDVERGTSASRGRSDPPDGAEDRHEPDRSSRARPFRRLYVVTSPYFSYGPGAVECPRKAGSPNGSVLHE